jgi:hypothetical protein
MMTRGGVAAAVAWIATLVVLIHQEPPAGAPDPAALAGGIAAAYDRHDAERLDRLLYEAPRGTAADLLAACGGGVTGARPRGSDRIELVTAGGKVCLALPIRERGGRWYVDAWAAPPG